MAEHAPFDPSRYLTKVGSSDYLEVKWRLVWLREVHPDAEIYTELISDIDQRAVFRAQVKIPNGGSATGYGSEGLNDFREYFEKAETKAIGRALAALGFGTQFCMDFDFSEGSGAVVDSPVAPRGTTTRQNSNGQHAPQARPGLQPTPRQFGMIRAVAQSIGMSDDDLHQFAGVASLNDLDRAQASKLIERLQALEADVVNEVHDTTDSGVPTGSGYASPPIVDWTAFWSQARAAGYSNKAAVEQAIGALGPDPQAALTRLMAKQHTRQPSLA